MAFPCRPLGVLAALSALLAGSCAVVPPPRYPAFEDLHLRAHYIVPGEGRLQIPATTREIVVRRLELTPPPQRESFAANGTRYAHYEDGTRVVLHGRFRRYRRDATAPQPPSALLPGASRIEVLPWHATGKHEQRDHRP